MKIMHIKLGGDKPHPYAAKIIKIYYKVYNKLGYGFLKKVYVKAMIIEFKKEGIPVEEQSAIKVLYEGEVDRRIFRRKAFDPPARTEWRTGKWRAGNSRK